MNENQAAKNRRYRGAILQMIHTNREDQMSRMDDLEVWGLLQDLNFELGQNQTLTLLQDLGARGYIQFEQKKNRITGRAELSKIELTPAGCDLVERIKTDPSILVP